MTSISLSALLDTVHIVHPTSVQHIRITDGTLVMDLRGFPWWLPLAEARKHETASATLEFKSISRATLTQSCLCSDPFNEDLDEFSIDCLAQVVWNTGNAGQIFCSEPIDRPIEVLIALERFLEDTQCPFGTKEFLVCCDSIETFMAHTRSSLFCLAQAPDAICEVLSKELTRQDVEHTISPSEQPFAEGYLVRWWDGFLVCDDAKMSW